ncbi:MAG: sigma-54-dependent transcriptional regulator [Planctomycetota bacterium]
MKNTILVADDEAPLREALADVLQEKDFRVLTAEDGREALRTLSEEPVDMALLDIRMPELTGMEVLEEAQEVAPHTQFIIITAFGTVENAVEAVQLGASDYVTKPIVFDDLFIKVERLLDMRRLSDENRFLHNQLEKRYSFEGIIGRSEALQNVLQVVKRLAQTRTSALITGESGTGKELVARAIHYSGVTAEGRFVPVNCAALPESLVESELFGHKKGAFSGAHRDKPGQFEVADGGTVFLDEIATMPLAIQPKLLRAIEEKRVQPVGGTEQVETDIRVLCASNRDLKAEVEAGRFRQDLYYRLNVVELHLPPLRDRVEDIPVLVNHFVEQYNRELKKDCPGVTDRAMRAMMSYSWPGNVRELKNVIEGALIFCDDEPVDMDQLSFTDHEEDPPGSGQTRLKDAVRAFEREHIAQTLHRHDGDKNAAAEALDIGLSSLYRKIQELDIAPQESEQAS